MITKETVAKIGELARLELTAQDIADLSTQMTTILDHFDELNQVQTAGIEPLTNPTEISGGLREDVVILNNIDVLANAPEKTGQLFKVPPIV